MSSIDVEDILRILSTKFNRIFCEREFVCCVKEDLQVILKNKNKCFVVVFPVLGPNYLKAVRYQAKIFDLSVFTLGSERICSIAVCHKDHLIKKLDETEEQIMPEREQDIGGSKIRKKRPERPLYVPPAQRRVPTHETTVIHDIKTDYEHDTNIKKTVSTIRKEFTETTRVKSLPKDENDFEIADGEHFLGQFVENAFNEISRNEFIQWEYELSETILNAVYFNRLHFRHCLQKWILFRCQQKSKVLYFLKNDYFMWQPAMNFKMSECKTCANVEVIPSIYPEVFNNQCNDDNKRNIISILVGPIYEKIYEVILKDIDVFCDYNVLWIRNGTLTDDKIFSLYGEHYYLIKNEYYECNDSLIENVCNYLDKEIESVQIPEIPNGCLSCVADITIPESIKNSSLIEECLVTDAKNEEPFQLRKSNSENSSNSEQFNESDICLQKNNIKNNVTNLSNTNENVKNSNELDEEKEIMRKAKENINRKTRPIMKYVEANNTLKIDKNENVNNWEDLFDEHGHLQEDLRKEIVHKVGNDVTIVKAKEDYSDYYTKQIEELEHMVELFDFPSTFATQDLIQAFSDINSEAMYVKWVDDTHAILVLGTLSQAQKAISIGHPLISVRPMTAASKESLATAYKHDLRPAMKRPQTNLQTARRLITSHLGKKTSISKETSAKEKEDLKAAKEMKKLVKKNEQDAWEGNLRSSKTK